MADIKVEAAGETGGFDDALLDRGSKMINILVIARYKSLSRR